MCFEWDERKAAKNLEKHGIDFADAAVALEDKNAITIEDPDHFDEQRFVSLAMGPSLSVLVIVCTWRNESLRIISARKANRSEIRRYEEDL